MRQLTVDDAAELAATRHEGKLHGRAAVSCGPTPCTRGDVPLAGALISAGIGLVAHLPRM